MNLAVPAVLLFLLVLPGLLFRRGYLKPPFPQTALTDEIAWALIPAVALHITAIAAVETFSSYRIDFKTLGLLLTGVQNDATVTSDFSDLGRYLGPVAIYNFTLWVVSYRLGNWARWISTKYDWDRKYQLLKTSDDWRALFEGRLSGILQEFDYVWLDVLVGSGAETIIYAGIMAELMYSPDGNIEAVVFLAAEKWITPNALSSIKIGGDAFVVKFADIRNLNVRYVRLGSVTPAETT
ncbi:MAG: hypothetical protein ACREQT_00360 [Candidatus Binataceae bacterium]